MINRKVDVTSTFFLLKLVDNVLEIIITFVIQNRNENETDNFRF